MNAKFVRLLSAVAMLLGPCVLAASPVRAAGTSITFTYVYFGFSGNHQRQPRTIGATGGFTLLKTQSYPNSLSPGGPAPIQQPTNPYPTKSCGELTCSLSFVTITGGSLVPSGLPTTVTWSDFVKPLPTIYVENAPINVLIVYVPTGGGGCAKTPCPPVTDWGATIDSYDETKEALFDDTFVKVAPDANGSLTTSGNVQGYVDTTNSAETITALSPTVQFDSIPVDKGDRFSRWMLLAPSATASNAPALAVAKQTSLTAIAVYDSPVSVTLKCQAVPSDVQNQLFVTNTTGQAIPSGSEISYTWTHNTDPSGGTTTNFVTTAPISFQLTGDLQPNKFASVPHPPTGTGGTCDASLSWYPN